MLCLARVDDEADINDFVSRIGINDVDDNKLYYDIHIYYAVVEAFDTKHC